MIDLYPHLQSHNSRSHLSKSTLYESDSSQTTVNSRSLRAKKRHKSEDSVSQASCSSPPSSPMFVPSKKQRILDSDSSYSDSDDANVKSVEKSVKFSRLRKRMCHISSMSASSDSDSAPLGPTPSRKKKRLSAERTEAYTLRKSTQHHLSPLKEHLEIKMEATETPLHEVNTKSTPTVSSSPAESQGREVITGETSASNTVKKIPTVAKRTRAHTKFENVSVSKHTLHYPCCVFSGLAYVLYCSLCLFIVNTLNLLKLVCMYSKLSHDKAHGCRTLSNDYRISSSDPCRFPGEGVTLRSR